MRLFIVFLLLCTASCSNDSNQSGSSEEQVRSVSSVCSEFEDPDMKRQCLIDAFGEAAVTGRSSN